MGMFALLRATRDRLRTRLNLTKEDCRVMKRPNPPAMAGDLFFSVFSSSWSPGDPDLNRGLDEYYGISVCLSCRTSHIPDEDQAEEAYIRIGESMENLIRRVITEIHQNIDVIVAANLLLGNPRDSVIEPLRWQGGDSSPIEVGADWFSGGYLTNIQSDGEDVAGLTLTANFGQARRPQTYANMVINNGD